MNRPHIICHMMVALDGKMIGEYMETKTAYDTNAEYDLSLIHISEPTRP